jgi:hypothetical protein
MYMFVTGWGRSHLEGCVFLVAADRLLKVLPAPQTFITSLIDRVFFNVFHRSDRCHSDQPQFLGGRTAFAPAAQQQRSAAKAARAVFCRSAQSTISLAAAAVS